jgi:organic hydroperoxide reductase OsmC/OhrA
MAEHKVAIEWHRDTPDFVYETYDRTYIITYSGGNKIQASNPLEYFGNAEFPNPEELLISALSGDANHGDLRAPDPPPKGESRCGSHRD